MHATRPRRVRTAPVIGRIAGLPVETLDAFSTGLCAALQAGDHLDAELARARAELADRLYEAVPGAPAALRRVLLAARRDCHNARGLARHRAAPEWPKAGEAVCSLAERVVLLEARVAAEDADFRAAYGEARERQRTALAETLRDPVFMRGLALASADLSLAARQASEARPGQSERRADRAEAALLRYVTRAAAKVSPFSTFTTLALGCVRRLDDGAGLRLRGAEWPVRSLVRLKRYRLEQYTEMLCRYPVFRDGLRVVLNDSATEVEPGRLLLVRPGRWEADEERGTLRYRPDALVRTAATPLVTRIAGLLAAERLPYGELAARLKEEGAAGEVDGLLELGVLRLVLPWPVHEGHLEVRMCAYLRTLSSDAALNAFTRALERLVELEAAYAAAKDPAAVLREMHGLTDDLWEAAAPLGGVDPGRVGYRGVKSYDFYEDVLRASPQPGRPAAPAFSMHAPEAREALRTGDLLVRLSTFFDHAHELRATLAHVAAERWPGRDHVGVLELFQAVQPLWRDYLEFRAQGWGGSDPRRTWNPRGLTELDRLHAWRTNVFDALAGCGVEDGDVWRMDEAALCTLLDGVPPRYTDPAGRGACLLLQPASRDGSLWRLNRLMEGTGRCGSRYTPVMDAQVRRRYTAHLAVRGWATVDGERAALLDLQCVHGDTLNVHAPQTSALLSLPGEEADVAPDRRLRLRELRVCFQGPHREPVLRGPSGERLLPVHLGLAFEAYLPPLIRFLASLGPGALRPVLPPRVGRVQGEVVAGGRMLLGPLVVHRRWWSVPAALLAAALAGGDDAAAFRAANRLRMAWGIPDRVFVAELCGTSHKPQYLDFTSPLFLGLLRGVVAGGQERLTLEEVLPDAEMCPRDQAGQRWAVEVALDSVALRGPGLRPPARRGGPGTRRVPQPA